MQCYIILYSNNGRFLIFEKHTRAYFFHNPAGGGAGGHIYPDGFPIKKGCLREFTEECGARINFIYNPRLPQTLVNLNSMTLDGVDTYPILGGRLNTVDRYYHCLYLEFTVENLRQIQYIILNTFFEEAKQARRQINNGTIRDYAAIHQAYPTCPFDDELGSVEIWDVQREINEIRLLNSNPATDWYYAMIMFLKDNILIMEETTDLKQISKPSIFQKLRQMIIILFSRFTKH